MAVVRPTRVYLLNIFCSDIQFNELLSPYLCFISFLYLDLYVLGDEIQISQGSFMQTLNILGPVPNLDCLKITTIELRQNADLVQLFVMLGFMSGIAILKIHNYIPDI